MEVESCRVAAVRTGFYDTLRQGILDGTYAQGTRLGETDLADSLGVSRTPVREALRRLGSEGLLATLPNKGARVRTWTAGELGDIFDLRALLEGHAAARAAARVTDADIGYMNDLVTRMEAATAEGVTPDIDLITELNGAFHRAVITASGNSLLPELMNSLIHVPVVSHTYRLYSRGPDAAEHAAAPGAPRRRDGRRPGLGRGGDAGAYPVGPPRPARCGP